jgi:lipid-binding SYLF domain-containing protein
MTNHKEEEMTREERTTRFCSKLRCTSVTMSIMATVLVGMMMFAAGGRAADATEQQQVVDDAKRTLESFLSDPGMASGSMIENLRHEAKALFIVPHLLRGAFIVGAASGTGVLLVRDEDTKQWSEPAFYNIGSASFGLQAGTDMSEIVFVVRSRKGLEEFYRSDFKLGSDVSSVVGPVGEGGHVKGIAADLVGFAKKKGAFVGVALDGSIIAVSDDSNAAYYGKSVRPTDILVKHSVSNPHSADLRKAAAKF